MLFLSYARADKVFALRLAQDLKAAGIEVWVDQFDVLPSQRWDRTLEAALRACAGLVVILSPRSVVSEIVMDEVGFAIDQSKDVIPLLYEACDIPLRIRRIQYIDFTQDYNAAFERCKSVIRAEPSKTNVAIGARRIPVPSRIWDHEVIHRAEQDLALYVGPIAKHLVETAGAQAASAAELYQLLAANIADRADRAAFLQGAANASNDQASGPSAQNSAPSTGMFSPSFLDAISRELMVYLGPISQHVVERESRESSNLDDLLLRLSIRLASVDERAAFLKRVRAIS